MDSTRRGFLGLLAHLPLVGAWLGRPKEVIPTGRRLLESQWQPNLTQVWSPCNVAAGPMMVKFSTERNRYEVVLACIGHEMERVVRWIPVTERLPEVETHVEVDDPVWYLVFGLGGIRPSSFYRLGDGSPVWGSTLDVTHWAELPAPPAQICAKPEYTVAAVASEKDLLEGKEKRLYHN